MENRKQNREHHFAAVQVHVVSTVCVWYTGLILTAPKRGSRTGGGLWRSAGTVRVQNWPPQPAGVVMGQKRSMI